MLHFLLFCFISCFSFNPLQKTTLHCNKLVSFDVFILAAMDYLLHHMSEPVDMAAFEQASGVGVVVTPDQIEAGVEAVINKHKQELLEKRYHVNTGVLMGEYVNFLLKISIHY